MSRDLKGYECCSLTLAMGSFSKPELHSWLGSSGSVFCVASFGKTLAETTLLAAMAEHFMRTLSYHLQCLTPAGLTC